MAKVKLKDVVATPQFTGSRKSESKAAAEVQKRKQALKQQGIDYVNIKQYGFAPDADTLADIAMSEYFMGLDQESANKQMEFQDYMSSTAHQREVEDLKAAGLNPVLSANNGASMGSGALASADTSAIQNKTSRQNMNAQLKNNLDIAKKQIEAQIQMNNATLTNSYKIAKLNNKTNLQAAKYSANQNYMASIYGADASAAATRAAAGSSAAAAMYAADQSYLGTKYTVDNPATVKGAVIRAIEGKGNIKETVNSAYQRLKKSWKNYENDALKHS